MKARIHFVVLLMVSLSLAALERKPGKPLEQLKAEADAARGGRQARLCSELALLMVDSATEQFAQGDIAKGQATVQEIVGYAGKARDGVLSSRSKMKEVEIRLRETQRHLENLKRTLTADDRPPLDAAEKKISDYRQEILDAMFGVKKKKEDKK